MAAKQTTAEQHEVTHEIGDGFVVAWDTHDIAVDLHDDLRDAASDEIERLGNDLISVKSDAAAIRPVVPHRRARPRAA